MAFYCIEAFSMQTKPEYLIFNTKATPTTLNLYNDDLDLKWQTDNHMVTQRDKIYKNSGHNRQQTITKLAWHN